MNSVRRFLIGFAVCFVWLAASAPLQAQDADEGQSATQRFEVKYAQDRIADWTKQLDDIEKELDDNDVPSRLLVDGRSITERILEAARTLQGRASERLERIKAAKSKLGEAPAEGQSEVPAVAEERDRLNRDIANVSGVIKQIELSNFRATEISDQLSSLARERFTRRILGRVGVPTDAKVWVEGWDQLFHIPSMVQARYANLAIDGKVEDQLGEIAPGLVLLAFVVIAALIGGEVIVLRYIPSRWKSMPTEDRVALVSGTRFLFTAMVPGIALLIAYQMVDGQPDLLSGSIGDFIHQCFGAALFLLFVGAAIRSIHSPFAPSMRRSGTTDHGARVVGLCSLAVALIFAWDMILLQGATTLGTSLDLALVQSVSNVMIISILLFVSSLGVFWIHDERDRHEFWAKLERRSRRGLKMISIALPLLMVLGYVALARFILENLMMAGAFLTSYWLLRGYARALMHTYLVTPETSDDSASANAVHGTLYFWLRVTIDVVMVVIAVPIAVMIFTDIAWVDLIDVAGQAFIGIQVGGFNISLRTILIAVMMFVIVLGLMRFFQRMLSTRVLPNTKLDEGLQHSVSAIFGYVGICLAVLLAISAAGLDLSNLAIIAGAISVGIGFGMQSIVNNFVSGLILLVERPIKVGDWIVVGADQGFVKDIRVRATEIETFDRSSIVIPNSELISNRVLNWTLKERSGRGIIKIGVSYGSDVEKVREILIEMADKRREILSYPAPQVVFMDFGASSLDFELRYFLRDIGDVLAVASSIRFELVQRFRDEGVEVPFPQRDLNLRDIDKLTDAIREAGQGRKKPEPEAPKRDEPAPSTPSSDDGNDTGEIGEGAEKKATPPSAAKDVSRDADAAGRSIPDAGGEPDGDAPR
ncbi:mechanosensitive ion channel domain-containing protein [Thalassospira lucentensis]|uniref:mechanosensitive ion channel domain-containing protein n=1 Tax=Thalassospira lucentensis TaxID=168935 RepID=UPI003AA96421